MKRARWLLAAGALAFAVSLVGRTPATFAYHWLGVAQRVPVELYDIRGLALNGEAKGVLGGDLAAERVSWRWRPVELFKGRFSLDTRVSNPKLALRARVGVAPGDRLYVDDLDGYVPLPLVLEKFATDAGVIEGNIEPQHLDLRWRGGVLSGLRGDLSLRRLRLAHQVGRPIAFGDALLSFAGDSSPWRAEIRDDGGPVRLSGQLSLGADGAYALDLLAGPRESDSAQGRVLATLGPADAEGRHRLSLSGSL